MKILLLFILFIIHTPAVAQKYISKSSTISFFSEAPLENIEAINKKATAIYDLSSGEIVFSVPIREFDFRKSLMKQHFNENYLESEIYPKSTFKGKIIKQASSKSVAVGMLNIHGVTKKVEIVGEVQIGNEEIIINAKFPILLKDYNVKIPRILFNNIAESVEVSIEFTFKPYVSN